MKIDPSDVTLRSATDEDREFAFAVKRAALRRYVEPIWGWDEIVQVDFHRNDWDVRRPDIIQLYGQDIGTIEIWRRADDIHFGEFYLLPEFQRKGIGSTLLRRLTDEADCRAVVIRLEVIRNNPVRSLYSRFGFTVTGNTATHFTMERKPKQAFQPTRTSAS